MTPPMLEVRGLTRRFGGLAALSEVSVRVPAGRTLGVIGPNGSGKSTLINVVTGHLKPTSGTVLINGRDLTGARPWTVAKAGVGRTFQVVKPFRGMSVRENVMVAATYGAHGRTAADAAGLATDVLARVGLAGQAGRAPAELSVADARRLELARALALEPRLLFLDEVLAGLRPAEIDPALDLIRALAAEGVTIVVVEHVVRAIVEVSDEVLVLHEGKVLTSGPPDRVMADPRVIEAYLGHRYARRGGA
ncbi:ATP-binding cassette domain-containing protein [Actinomadura fulvescens]|uniref:ABC transporter ATP-binding protein n=1 Tax=Actinomadura fulvescens TaxID=46160 RepID=A0ABN3QBY6_9ACTN